jgi:hypothetical protein
VDESFGLSFGVPTANEAQARSALHPARHLSPGVPVTVSETVRTRVSGLSEDLLQGIIDKAARLAQSQGLQLDRVNVRLDLTDIDSADRQVVICFWLRTEIRRAFQYLDDLDEVLQRSLGDFGNSSREFYMDKIVLQAQWL